jgi:ethanolamine utilization protein EutL
MLLEPILPKILAVQHIPQAHPNVLLAYGADPARHTSLGLITCDQDDSTYVALDEATKHAHVDVVFAQSFYAGAAHASGALSGEILGVIAGADPDEVAAGMQALVRCLEHDVCFYGANEEGTVAVFPHVIASLGHYLSAQAGLPAGASMAYLVAPPIEASVALDAALKAADVVCTKVFTPPTETNFAAAWLSGLQHQCEAAAETYAQTVVNVAAFPRGRERW